MNIHLILKQLFRTVGLEVKLYNHLNGEVPLLIKLIKDFNIKTVIDTGANTGQYASQLLRTGFKGTIYSFEPISKPFQILKKHAEGNSHWHPIQSAIGSKDDESFINVSENIVSSSIYEVNDNSLSAEPSTRTVRKEKIKVITLDSFFGKGNLLERDILLKLDVQGFELEALRGGIKALKEIRIIQAELSFVPLYKEAPLFLEVVSFLESQGFEIFTIFPGFRDATTGRLLQADGLFIKK